MWRCHISDMEYVNPAIILKIIFIASPALMSWFYVRYVEPKAKLMRQREAQKAPPHVEITNVEKANKVRQDLDKLKRRLVDC